MLDYSLAYQQTQSDNTVNLGFTDASIVDDDDTLTTELRLNGNWGDNISWISGVFYRDQDTESLSSIAAFGIIDSLAGGQNEQWAVFGEMTYGFGDGAYELALGGRYYEEDRVVADNLGAVDTDESLFSPKINLAWFVHDDLMVWGNVAQGYRSPEVNTPAALMSAELFGLPLPRSVDAETMWTYELGTKMSLANGRVSLETAMFYNDWKDFQYTFVVPSGLGGLTSVDKVEGYGIDLAITAQITDGLTARFGGNYNDTEIPDDFFVTDSIFGVESLSIIGGEQPGFNVKWTFTASVDYVTDLNWKDFEFVFYSDATYADKFFGSLGNSDPTPGSVPFYAWSDKTALVNARIGIQNERYGVFLYVDNVFDSDNILQPRNPLANAVGTEEGNRFKPRVIGVNLKVNF